MEESVYEWLLLLTFIGCCAAIISSGDRFYLVGLAILLFANGFIEVTFGYDLVTKPDRIGTLSTSFIKVFVLNVVYFAALCYISENDYYVKHKSSPHASSRDPATMRGNRSNLVDKIIGQDKY